MTTSERREEADGRRNNERWAVRNLALEILRQAPCGTIMTLAEATAEARKRLEVRG